MSRVGKQPISLPGTVKVAVESGAVRVTGPKGSLDTPVPEGISCAVDGGSLVVSRGDDSKTSRSLHGLTRALLANAVKGVTEGFKRELDIVGVGYKATLDGNNVVFNLGHSHPITLAIPEGIQITVEKSTHVVVTGFDRQKVGQIAAQIRSYRKPEPYKGKGVHYSDETIIRKAGKAAK